MSEINVNPTTAPSNPPNASSEADWTSPTLGGTGYEVPPSQVTKYTPLSDIVQRIFDTVALAVKVRTQSGSNTASVGNASGNQVSKVPGVVGTLSNNYVNAGAATATGLIEVYDGSPSGTLLWAGTLAAGGVVKLDMPVQNGIYVSIATGTVAVSYSGSN